MFVDNGHEHLLAENGGPIKLSKSFIHRIFKRLGKTFRKSTTKAQKLPERWEEVAELFTMRVAFLVKKYDIDQALVLNSDQTPLQYCPTGGSYTYARKGCRDVALIGKDDKRGVTALLGISASGRWF